jgi:hypothetical protein
MAPFDISSYDVQLGAQTGVLELRAPRIGRKVAESEPRSEQLARVGETLTYPPNILGLPAGSKCVVTPQCGKTFNALSNVSHPAS